MSFPSFLSWGLCEQEGWVPAPSPPLCNPNMPHQGGLYQNHATVRAPRVLLEERVDGTLRITHQGRPLDFHEITSRPMKAVEAKTVYQPRRPVTPRPDHPWRQRLRPERRTQATVARP